MAIKTKSFSITLDGITAQALSDWASAEKRSRGNLIAFILEIAARHKYPDRYSEVALPESAVVLSKSEIDPDKHEAMRHFLQKLAEGKANKADGAIAASAMGAEPDAYDAMIDKLMNGNGGKASAISE